MGYNDSPTTRQRSNQNHSPQPDNQANNSNNVSKSQIRVKPILFNYPSLPSWEIRLYFAIIIGTIAWGWYCVVDMSNNIQKLGVRTNGDWAYRRHWLFGKRVKDLTNYEWTHYNNLAWRLIPALIAHSAIYRLIDQLGGDDKEKLRQYLRTILGIACSCYTFGTMEVLLTIVYGVFTFTVTRLTQSKTALWISTLPVLYSALHSPLFEPSDEFAALVLSSYKLLAYISYNMEYINGRTRPQDQTWSDCFLRMLHYAYYLPYGCALIVLYHDFESQLIERPEQKRPIGQIFWRTIRLAFWWFLVDSILYFAYFEAFLRSPKFLMEMRQDQLTALGCAVGQFFHMKYVVIFGVGRLFAWLDGLQPPQGPICVSRVILYAQIWRQFDRGLYGFFKEYIFLPICRPTFSVWRKLAGVFVAYSFVLLWHGFERHNIVWIVVNVVELFLESGARALYSIKAVRDFREKHISDTNFLRVIAWLLWVPFAFALYSNFYFLAGKRAGWIFVKRIFIGETLTLQYPFWLLISLGYCYAHICMQTEQWMYDREMREKKIK